MKLSKKLSLTIAAVAASFAFNAQVAAIPTNADACFNSYSACLSSGTASYICQAQLRTCITGF